MRPAAHCGLLLALAGQLAIVSVAHGQDELRVGTGTGLPGGSAKVALRVRDLAGTLLDEGDGPGLEIQGFALRIEYPAAAITSCDFFRAGVTSGQPPLMSSVGRGAGYCYVLFAFSETNAPLTFTLDRPPPGDTVGNFLLGLSPGLVLGDGFAVSAVASTAILDNGQGTLSETPQNGHLAIADGWVEVTTLVFQDGFESGDLTGWSEARP